MGALPIKLIVAHDCVVATFTDSASTIWIIARRNVLQLIYVCLLFHVLDRKRHHVHANDGASFHWCECPPGVTPASQQSKGTYTWCEECLVSVQIEALTYAFRDGVTVLRLRILDLNAMMAIPY